MPVLVRGHHLGSQAAALGQPDIHPHEFLGEQAGFVTARAGAQLHDGIAVVIRVSTYEPLAHVVVKRAELRLCRRQLIGGQLGEFGVR